MRKVTDTQRKKLLGYGAGILAGASYGTNPLFAKPLLQAGLGVPEMLFFRYSISALLMLAWLLLRRESLRVNFKQLRLLILLGLLFSCSSLFLFLSYLYIPSGLATTLVYLYPVFVALTMVALRIYPGWQTWLSIIATFLGIILLAKPTEGAAIGLPGILLAIASALSYAFYLVIVNRSKRIRNISEHVLTFFALLTGTALFSILLVCNGNYAAGNLDSVLDWGCVIGLAVFPTMISMLTLALSTRYIGPTKTSVLGVFEPITAIMIGTLIFGEQLTIQMIAGIAICVGAIVFMVLKPGK